MYFTYCLGGDCVCAQVFRYLWGQQRASGPLELALQAVGCEHPWGAGNPTLMSARAAEPSLQPPAPHPQLLLKPCLPLASLCFTKSNLEEDYFYYHAWE